jgi:hypothetical protein
MGTIRAVSIAAILGLVVLTTTSPAAAYIIEALTSISADEAVDKETLENAIRAAVDDVAAHAVGFTPTVVSLREAKLIGGRIYLFVLLADAAGEAEMHVLEATAPSPGPDAR